MNIPADLFPQLVSSIMHDYCSDYSKVKEIPEYKYDRAFLI